MLTAKANDFLTVSGLVIHKNRIPNVRQGIKIVTGSAGIGHPAGNIPGRRKIDLYIGSLYGQYRSRKNAASSCLFLVFYRAFRCFVCQRCDRRISSPFLCHTSTKSLWTACADSTACSSRLRLICRFHPSRKGTHVWCQSFFINQGNPVKNRSLKRVDFTLYHYLLSSLIRNSITHTDA